MRVIHRVLPRYDVHVMCTRRNAVLPLLERLPDGSFRSEIVADNGQMRLLMLNTCLCCTRFFSPEQSAPVSQTALPPHTSTCRCGFSWTFQVRVTCSHTE